jgi:hypothetical protein
MEAKTTLQELKDAHDRALAEEKELRQEINELRRDLTKVSQRRLRAYRAWEAESKRLVG